MSNRTELPWRPSAGDPDGELRRRIRRRLPAEAFRHRPWRALLEVPFLLILVLGSAALIHYCPAWFLALPASVLLGATYASFFFFGHELAHGGMVRARRLQDVLLYPPFMILGLSPHLWRVWHHTAHHAHTNTEEEDPDIFGTLASYQPTTGRNLFYRLSPGSRHWLCLVYFFVFFSLHTQVVLWVKSRSRHFRRMRRSVAVITTMLIFSFWSVLASQIGGMATLYVIVIPMAFTNAVIMSYIATNHQLRCLAAERGDTLSTTMSVRTLKVLDVIHFNFSHHVEHHLFPSMSSAHAPLVRRALEELERERYVAPSHWRALAMLFRTPRLYERPDLLGDPFTGEKARVAAVARCLQRGAPRRVPVITRAETIGKTE